MPVVPQFRFEILDDPVARMQGLRQGARNVILRKAVRAAAKPVREAVKRHAPRQSGTLAGSISVRIGTNRKTGAVYAVVGPRRGYQRKSRGEILSYGKPTKYAHLVEFGTAPHSLVKGDKLARRTKAGRQSGGGKGHPGAKAHPFLGPAYRAVASYSRADMERVIKEEVEKKLAKAAKKKR
jgi:HK97 gp10 family phage protein